MNDIVDIGIERGEASDDDEALFEMAVESGDEEFFEVGGANGEADRRFAERFDMLADEALEEDKRSYDRRSWRRSGLGMLYGLIERLLRQHVTKEEHEWVHLEYRVRWILFFCMVFLGVLVFVFGKFGCGDISCNGFFVRFR